MVFILSTPNIVPALPPSASKPVIVRGDDVIEPRVVDGYESTRESGTLVHRILGKPTPDVTIRPAHLRTGTLSLVFDDETAAARAEDLHANGGVFTLKVDDLTTVTMNYVPVGRLGRQLDDGTRAVWIVTVEFQEVGE